MSTNAKKRNYLIILFVTIVAGFLICFYFPFGRYFTNAATRIAFELEEGAKIAKAQLRYTMEHKPLEKSRGCSEDYIISVDSKQLTVICKNKDTEHTMATYSTSEHLKFVDSPKTLSVRKKMGESAFIYLEYIGGRVYLSELR